MPTVPAILGTARLGNFRLGYVPGPLTAIRQTRVTITVAGFLVRYRSGSVTIRDIINDTPNTCVLTLINPDTPPLGQQRVRVTINSDAPRLLFAGALETVGESYVLLPGQQAYTCTAQDDTPRANRRIPLAYYEDVSATTVAQELVADFAPGFTTNGVQAGLPNITVHFEGSEAGMNGCLRQIAKLIGGYFYWQDRDLHLFTEETDEQPDDLDSTPGRILDDPHITIIWDDSQLRTRVYGKGHQEATLAEIAIGATVIPLGDVSMYNPAGGQVISESQIADYTGIDAGGTGALVGELAVPTNAPVALRENGTGNLTAGVFLYAVTFYDGSGETTPGPTVNLTLPGTVAAPSNTATISLDNGGSGGSGDRQFKYTFYDATEGVETSVSGLSNVVTTGSGNFTIRVHKSSLSSLPTGMTYRFYIKSYEPDSSNVNYRLLTPTSEDGTYHYFNSTPLDLSGNTLAPTSNTAVYQQARLSDIPRGPTGTTGRRLQRTVVNGSQLKRLVDLADNTTTTYADNVADGSLGVNVPTTNTSGIASPSGLVNAGSTTVTVTAVGPFLSAGGWAYVGGQYIRYTGKSATQLTGIPTSGAGAVTSTLKYGTEILAAPLLTGVSGLVRPLIKGAPIHIWVQRDDLAAQAELIAREGEGDGIIEHRIVDDRRGYESLIALCDADLAQFSRPIVTVTYATRDTKTKSGKPIVIDLPSPLINETLTIQDVTITELDIVDGLAPKFTVTASSVRFSLEDLLRRMAASLEGQ